MEEHELYQDFDLKDYSSILYSLKYYYHKSGDSIGESVPL